MLYTLLTKDEIEAIEEILKTYSVRYEVLVDEELIRKQNESMKNVLNRYGEIRRTNAFYNLSIDKYEFDKIPLDAQKNLERYNIYPEISEIPFRAETPKIDSPLKVTVEKKIPWTTRVLSWIVILLFVYIGLTWLDQYVIQVLPSSFPGSSYHGKRIFQ